MTECGGKKEYRNIKFYSLLSCGELSTSWFLNSPSPTRISHLRGVPILLIKIFIKFVIYLFYIIYYIIY